MPLKKPHRSESPPERASTPDRAEPNVPPREDDPHVSPLGRGANPGTAVESGPLDASGIGGLHGRSVPGARGGPSGEVDRENEDVVPKARRDADRLKG